MSLDAMKQALEFLEFVCDNPYRNIASKQTAVMDALRAAIEQAQEPVAWMYVNTDGECEQIEYIENDPMPDDPSVTPLYTAPRQWQGLTDEDREEILRWVEWKEIGSQPVAPQKLIAYVERKLREKNT